MARPPPGRQLRKSPRGIGSRSFCSRQLDRGLPSVLSLPLAYAPVVQRPGITRPADFEALPAGVGRAPGAKRGDALSVLGVALLLVAPPGPRPALASRPPRRARRASAGSRPCSSSATSSPASAGSSSSGPAPSDYLQFLVAADIMESGTGALLEHVAARRDAWDFCDFQQIPDGSPLAALPAPAGVEARRFVQETCPYLPLPGSGMSSRAAWGRSSAPTWDTTDAPGARVRGGVDRGRQRQHGQCMDRFFALHQRRWNQRGCRARSRGAGAARSTRRSARRLQARGWLRLHMLRLDGREQAALYCFSHGGRGYYTSAASSRNWPASAPGPC